MDWRRVKNYLFAGLDFMVNQNEEPFLIESNCLPGGSFGFEWLTGKLPYQALIERVFTKKKNVCLLHDNLFDDHDKLVQLLKTYQKQGKIRFHFCPYKKQMMSMFPLLVDSQGKKVSPDCCFEVSIFDYFLLEFELSGTLVINSMATKSITFDKWLTYLTLKKAGIKQPETIKAKGVGDIKSILKSGQFQEYVLKPQFGRQGRGIMFSKGKLPKGFETNYKRYKPYLIQERIYPKDYKKGWWDTRSYVAAGEFIGAYKRVSDDPITNIHRGGHRELLDPRVEKKLSKVAVKAVKAISDEAQHIKNANLLHRIVEETHKSLWRGKEARV